MRRVFISVVFCLLASSGWAADRYYDATGGSDAGAGTEGSPYQTIDKLNTDLNAASCGDRFFLKRGETWTANDTSDNIELINKQCTSSTKIVVDAYGSGALPIIDGVSQNANTGTTGAGIYVERSNWIEIKNIVLRDWNTNIFSGVKDVLVDGIEIDGTGKEGFRVKRHTASPNVLTERFTLQNSTIHEAGQISNGECIYLGIDPASSGGVQDVSHTITIKNNTIHTCIPEAIEAKPGIRELVIERNVIHTVNAANNTSGAVLLHYDETGVTNPNHVVRFNHIYNVHTALDGNCIFLRGGGRVYGNILQDCVDNGVRTQDFIADGFARLVYNNTIYSNDAACTSLHGAGSAARNNICWANGSGNDASDPLFVNAAGGDFALQAASPALDNGTSCDLAFNGSSCDRGAHETIIFSGGEVGLVDATSVILTFANNLHPPLLPATGMTGFTIEEDTGGGFVAKTVSGCIRQGTNQIDCTVTVGFSAGSSARFSYSTGTGNVTDSALIGNSANQRLNAITNQAITNNVEGAAPSHVFEQKAFQFYGVRTNGGLLVKLPHSAAAVNTSISTVPGGSVIIAIQIDGTAADPPAIGVIPYYSKNSGSYTIVPGSFSADNIRIGTSQTGSDVPSAGEAVSTALSGALTTIAGQHVASADAVPTFDLAQDNSIVNRWVIEFDTDVTAADTYDIRLYNQDTNALNTYTVTPRITIIGDRAGGGAS